MITIMLLSLVLSANAMPCPEGCSCGWTKAILQVDCSNLGLTEVPDFDDMPVEILNLSNNLIKEFPTKLSQIKTLTNLNLSGNLITTMKMTSLVGFTSLNALILSDNGISNWKDLSPNTVLLPAINLHTLSLARNPLNTLSSSSQDLLFVSNSLKLLDLSECGISKVMGQFVLQGLTKLEKLILTGNPIRYYTPLTSNSLNVLELKNCTLTKIPANSFTDLPKLITLDLSHNPRLTLTSKPGEYAQSESVQNLDIGYCNIDLVELSGFPNLINLTLRYNMLRTLTQETFESNQLLENLQISNNNIREIGLGTFFELRHLKHLDLSYNAIARIDKNLFLENQALASINLSRNQIKTLRKIFSSSIVRLDFSGCEIMSIDQNALVGLPKLVELNLSKNLLSEFPSSMVSSSLEGLDLSMCKITSIRNNTFRYFPSLVALDLSGNRLTTPPKVDYFKGNKYLHQLWLSDNPWRCDCEDLSFKDFYIYITQSPEKVSDKHLLKCTSPDSVYGLRWQQACLGKWFPTTKATNVWFISLLVLLIPGFILIISVHKIIVNRKRNRDERIRSRNFEEQRRISRLNARILEQEGQHIAPVDREPDPPPYDEAVNMPKLERAYKSMAALEGMQQRQSNSEYNDDLILDYRRRFQSDEVILARESERTRNVIFTRRTGDLTKTSSKSQNLPSVEKIANFQSRENSPYSRRKPSAVDHEQIPLRSVRTAPRLTALNLPQGENFSSTEIIRTYDSMEGSPYCQRVPKPLCEAHTSMSQWTCSTNGTEDHSLTGSISIVEEPVSDQQSPTSSSNAFQILDHDSSDSVESEPFVTVHQPVGNQKNFN